jgi:putative endonuclease
MYFVYFLKSLKNAKIYTGSTGQLLEKRLRQHNIGLNKWTSENGPFDLIYFESYSCKTDARKRENFYKTGLGRKIRNLIIDAVSQFPP